MRLFTKLAQAEDSGIPSKTGDDIRPSVTHDEGLPPQKAGWQVFRAGDGDTAMAIFSTPDEVHEPIDPDEARRLERKIDFMILPYLAVSVVSQSLLWANSNVMQVLCILLHRQNNPQLCSHLWHSRRS